VKDYTEKISIRQATVNDANLISVLGAVTFYEAYFEQDDPSDLANYIAEAFAPEKIRAEIENPDSTFFIVFLENYAVGYAKLRAGEKHESVESENAVELQRIYLVERVFGKGVGEILLRHCVETARRKGFDTLWLGVWQENRRALKFYAKHGFKQVGTLTFPYGKTVGTNLVLQKKSEV
jgi:Acetyltransferases